MAFVIKLTVSAVVFAFCFIFKSATNGKLVSVKNDSEAFKKHKKRKRLLNTGMIISGWYALGVIISELFNMKGELNVEFDMFSLRTEIFGISVADTTIISYCITFIILILLLIFRFVCIPKFKDKPGKFQNLMELMVEAMDKFVNGVVGEDVGKELSPYMLSLAIFMIFSAACELIGLRAPTSDLVVTFSLGLITFALINIYGVRKKGIGGRIKSMANPNAVMMPMKIVSDIAVPVSLACRLFGNMIGGMIVMELLKSTLGGYASGITSVAGLYFNLFHPLIQTYVFIILSLTFIEEAIE